MLDAQQDLPNLLSYRRRSRVAQQFIADAVFSQPPPEQSDLRTLAAAVRPIKNDELTCKSAFYSIASQFFAP